MSIPVISLSSPLSPGATGPLAPDGTAESYRLQGGGQLINARTQRRSDMIDVCQPLCIITSTFLVQCI